MRKCYRCIDRPQVYFGLEIEDVALLSVGVGIGSLLIEPYIPGIVGACSWIMLVKFKQGKPPGYVLHCLYAYGIDLPGLLPSWKKIQHYGAYGSH